MNDPFDKPLLVNVGDNSELAQAFRRLAPQEIAEGKAPAVVLPASMPSGVADATPDAVCHACGQKCWVAPSSLRVEVPVVFLCIQCIARELRLGPNPN